MGALPLFNFFIEFVHNDRYEKVHNEETGQENEDDIKMKYWVRLFNNYDLYSKENVEVDIENLKTYYINLFLNFFNNNDRLYV